MIDLAEIAQKIHSGDKQAFESLFKHCYSALCDYATKYILTTEEAEEVVQDVFVNFWEKREAIEINESVEGYLYRSVRNSCFNQIKHLQVREKYANEQLSSSLVETFSDDFMEGSELSYKISTCIESLPEERRKIFLLSREEGLKYKEIAVQLNISVKTVEAQMGKSLKHFRKHLAEYLVSLFLLMIINEML